MLKRILGRKCKREHPLARELYDKIVTQARQPFIFREFGLEDTLQGRFESLALHLFIILNTLKSYHGQEDGEIVQDLCDAFVADMDHSLRAMTLSEGKVNKHIKKFVEGFYGRLVAYDDACANEDDTALLQSLLKNIYDSNESSLKLAQRLGQYVQRQRQALRHMTIAEINFVTSEGLKPW